MNRDETKHSQSSPGKIDKVWARDETEDSTKPASWQSNKPTNEEIKPDDVFLVSTEGLAGAVYKNSSCEILLHDIFICCGLETPDTTFLLSNLTTLSWLAQQ